MVDLPPKPSQVRLTSPRSARAQKTLAAVVTAAGRSDAVLDVLVDPTVRTWAVVH
ncbi:MULTISPECIES: hypothetical protein [Saccharothrix]|uniref:hypothetical protein n=1 Tax=Saccharothrix TaxID=2071 RepID=UPI0013010FC3|nr:hypothetical protein [Saccharothrix sp. CB00851]